jgi:hypothetical protein
MPGEVFRCAENKRLLEASSSAHDYVVYRSVTLVFECNSHEQVLSLVDKFGMSVELDRFPQIEGARPEVRLVTIGGLHRRVDMVIAIYGFEPSADGRAFRVDVYRLDVKKKIFEAWSTSTPIVKDCNGDGSLELVLFEDLFSINRLDVPNWPRIFELAPTIRAADLQSYQSLIANLEARSITALEGLGELCRVLKDKPCPLDPSIRKLKAQIAALAALKAKIKGN